MDVKKHSEYLRLTKGSVSGLWFKIFNTADALQDHELQDNENTYKVIYFKTIALISNSIYTMTIMK